MSDLHHAGIHLGIRERIRRVSLLRLSDSLLRLRGSRCCRGCGLIARRLGRHVGRHGVVRRPCCGVVRGGVGVLVRLLRCDCSRRSVGRGLCRVGSRHGRHPRSAEVHRFLGRGSVGSSGIGIGLGQSGSSSGSGNGIGIGLGLSGSSSGSSGSGIGIGLSLNGSGSGSGSSGSIGSSGIGIGLGLSGSGLGIGQGLSGSGNGIGLGLSGSGSGSGIGIGLSLNGSSSWPSPHRARLATDRYCGRSRT